MPTVNVHVPMTAKSFYKPSDAEMIQNAIEDINSRHGSIINHVAELTNVPELLISSFSYIESNGQNLKRPAGSRFASGVMQIDPATATAIIWKEWKLGRLSQEEEKLLRKHLGNRLDCIKKQKSMNQIIACTNKGSVVTQTDLAKLEFNYLAGSIFLGLLLDQEVEKGIIRLDKVVLRYNRGYFAKADGTVDNVIAHAKSKYGTIASSYILKLVGTHGLLHIHS